MKWWCLNSPPCSVCVSRSSVRCWWLPAHADLRAGPVRHAAAGQWDTLHDGAAGPITASRRRSVVGFTLNTQDAKHLKNNSTLLTLCLFVFTSRWLLSDQRLWGYVPDQKHPGGAGSQSAELWNQGHTPPVAPPAYHPALCPILWWLPGKNSHLHSTPQLKLSFTSVFLAFS